MKKRDDQPRRLDTQWPERHLKKRECCAFIPGAGGRSSRMCQCGRKRTAHTSGCVMAGIREQQWTSAQHTREVPTDAAGLVQFSGSGTALAPASTSHYARISSTTSENLLLDLLLNQWKLPQPDILISVTGGAKTDELSDEMRERFRRGLLKVGMASNAWMLSAGTNTGVMKLVGDVVQEYAKRRAKFDTAGGDLHVSRNLCAVGIATWSAVDNRSSLVQLPLSAVPVRYSASSSRALNPNHSHFLLVDDGSLASFGSEIKLRARFEKAMSRCQLKRANGELGKISVVMIAVEGGPNTLKTVRQAAAKGLPVVLVQGSGRATDLLVFAHGACSSAEGHICGVPDHMLPDLRRKISESFHIPIGGGGGDKEYRRLRHCEAEVQACMKHRNMFYVVNLTGGQEEDNLDYAILRALLQVNAGSAVEQLNLALTWNRADFAEKEVFEQVQRWKPGILDSVLMRALMEGKIEFIKLLLQSEAISIEKFASQSTVLALYNAFSSVVWLRTLFLRYGITPAGDMSLEDLSYVVGRLVGHSFSRWYQLHPEVEEEEQVRIHRAMTKRKRAAGHPAFLASVDSDTDSLVDAVGIQSAPVSPALARRKNSDAHAMLDSKRRTPRSAPGSPTMKLRSGVRSSDVALSLPNSPTHELGGVNPLPSPRAQPRHGILAPIPSSLLSSKAISPAPAATGTSASRFKSLRRSSAWTSSHGNVSADSGPEDGRMMSEDLDPGDICTFDEKPSVARDSLPKWRETWETACNHLFLWSIVTGQKSVSRILWQHTTEPIAAALMACKLLRSLAEMLAKDQTYDEEREELNQLAEQFEELAIGVLTVCHKCDDFTTRRLIRRILPYWGMTTCLALADGSESKDFVAHNSCQGLLNCVWTGRLQPQNSSLAMCVCVILPPLIPFVLSFAQYSTEDAERLTSGDDGDNSSLAPSLNELAFVRPLSPTQQEMFSREEQDLVAPRSLTKGILNLQELAKSRQQGRAARRVILNPLQVWSGAINRIDENVDGPLPPAPAEQQSGVDLLRNVSKEDADDKEDSDNEIVYNINQRSKSVATRKYYKLRISQRFMAFYSAPVVKFWIALLSYLIFLGLFSYMILHRWDTCTPTAIELMVLFYIGSLATIEARQISQDPSPLWSEKLASYLSSLWNWLDVASLTLYLIHLPLRYSCPSELQCTRDFTSPACNSTTAASAQLIYPSELRYGRILCSTACLLFYLRLLQIFTVNSDLGPKIHMIIRMVLDVLEFALIFLIFVVSFGVTSQAMLYPTEDLTWTTAKEIFYRPYWQIYGEFFLETVAEGGESCGGDGQRQCPQQEFLPIIFLAVYALMSNILLIDLLSAVFNNTYEAVQGQAVQIWKFNRYSLVMEYLSRSKWPPPFSVISQILLSIAQVIGLGKTLRGDISELAEVVEDTSDIQQLQEFEQLAMRTYVHAEAEQAEESSEEGVRMVDDKSQKFQEMTNRLAELEATIHRLCESLQHPPRVAVLPRATLDLRP